MAHIISIANMKGGVGKTTLCVSLAEGLSYLSKHVLVIDLDAQTNCSQVLWGKRQGNPWKDGENIHGFLHQVMKTSAIDPFLYIKRHIVVGPDSVGAVSLFCGSPLLFSFERQNLSDFRNGIDQLEAIYAKAIDKIYEREADNFDFIIFDCPPGISLLAEAALKSSDLIIIPTAPNFLSAMGIQAFSEFLTKNSHCSRYVFLNQCNNSARRMVKYKKDIEEETKKPSPLYMMFKNYYKHTVKFQQALVPYDGSAFHSRYAGEASIMVKNVAEEVIGIVNDKPNAS